MDFHQQQALQKAIIENSGNAIIAGNEQGIISLFNQAAEQLLGYAASEVVGKHTPVIFYLPEEMQARAIGLSEELQQHITPDLEVFSAKARLGMPSAEEWTMVKKDGTQFPVIVSVSALQNQEGDIDGFLGVITDISKRKSLEQKLVKSEERFKKLFNTSPDPVWIIDRQKFVDCNHAALDLMRCQNKDTLLNTHPSELSPEIQPDGQPSFDKAENMIALTFEHGMHRFEWMHQRFDGTNFWAEVTLSLIDIDGKDLIYCIWRDITERKMAQEALTLNEQRLSDILDNISDWVWEVDLEGNFNFVHGDTETILGYSNDEILKMNAFDLMSGEEAEKIGKEYDEIIKSERPFRYMVNVNLHRDGSRKYLLSSGVPVFDENQTLIGYRGAGQDYTQSILLKEKLQKSNLELEEKVELRTRELHDAVLMADAANTEKSRFLANMSHELRTPMHAILSFANLGLKRVNDDKVERYLQNIRTSGIRLTNLIDDLLDLSKLEAGKFEVNFVEQDIVTLVQNATEEVSSLIGEKDISINLNFESSLNCFIDHKLMTQVVINLLSNAVKFSPSESVIEIEIRQLDYAFGNTNKKILRISVFDQGIGVPVDEQASIFDKFIQSKKTMTDAKGTGLGLAITKEIVELHHGQIRMESPPQGMSKGSVFIVEIPTQQPKESTGKLIKMRDAIDAHLEWKQNIDDIFESQMIPSDLNSTLIENEFLCNLGEWLSQHESSASDNRLLKDVHRNFHIAASECLGYLRANDIVNAQAAKNNFDLISDKLIQILSDAI